MAIDFPASPTVGQEHVSGGMTYVYNGTGWTVKGGSTTSFVLKAGDTMTGVLQVNQEIIAKAGHAGGHGRMRIDNDGGSLTSKLTFRSVGADMWDVGAGGSAPQDFAISSANGVALAINRTTSEVTTPIDPISALGVVNLRSMKAYAAPLDAMAYSGMQVNGSCAVSQEITGTQVNLPSAPSTYSSKNIIDGWQVEKVGTSSVNAYQLGMEVPGITHGIQLHATVAQAVMGVNDFVRFRCPIEGYRTARLAWGTSAAMPVTVGFHTRMTLPGTYRAALVNNDLSAASSWMPFTVTSSMAWQWNTITFSPITTGTWNKDNLTGMALLIDVASQGTPNTVGAINQFAGITGLIVLPGTQAPTAAQSPLIMRPYDQELVTCQRYWEKGYSSWDGTPTINTPYGSQVYYKAIKRASPTIVITNIINQNFPATGNADAAPSRVDGFKTYRIASATAVIGGFTESWTADARL